MPGLPDHFNGVQLFGVFNNTLTAVAVDSDGNLYALLQGYDGAVYVPLRVDADGRIEAVLKGEYAGVLDTVALDDQGRLLVVPTDPENIWGNAISIGNAELAARLGAQHVYDRRGELVWQTDFSTGLEQYNNDLLGTGAASEIELVGFRRSGYVVALTAGSTTPWENQLFSYFAPATVNVMGVETGLAVDANVDHVDVEMLYYDGEYQHHTLLRFDFTNTRLSILTGIDTYTVIDADYKQWIFTSNYANCKLVADFVNETYVRALVGPTEYDISAETYLKNVDVTAPHVELTFNVFGKNGVNGVARFDHWILTLNEPT